MKTEKFSRKPFTVEAVQVTAENMEEVAKWTKGTIHETAPEIAEKFNKPIQKWIQIEVQHSMNDRQTKAFEGDYVLFANRGFKIYTAKAFERNFERPADREIKIHVEDNRHGDIDPGSKKGPTPKDLAARAIVKDAKVHEVSLVAEDPNPAAGVHPIEMVTRDSAVHQPKGQVKVNQKGTDNFVLMSLAEAQEAGYAKGLDSIADGVTLTIDVGEEIHVNPTGQAQVLTPAEKAKARSQQVTTENLGGLT